MGIDKKTVESGLSPQFVSRERVIVRNEQPDSLDLVTDLNVSPEREETLAFITAKERVHLHSILEHPALQADFDDTMKAFENIKFPQPPASFVGCDCETEQSQ